MNTSSDSARLLNTLNCGGCRHGPGKVDIRARVMAVSLVRGGVSCVVLDGRFDMRARFPKIGGATRPSPRKMPCPRRYLP